MNKAKATFKLYRRSPSSLLALRADQEQLVKKYKRIPEHYTNSHQSD